MTQAPEPDISQDTSSFGETKRDRLLSWLVVLTGALFFLAAPFAMRAAAGFVLPIVVAAILSLALAPFADWLESKRFPNWLAALLALAAMVLVLAMAGAMVVQPAIGLVDSLPAFAQRVSDRTVELSGWLGEILQKIDSLGSAFGGDGAREVVMSSRATLQDMLLQTPGVLLHVVVTLLLAYFMTEARARLRRQLVLDRVEFSASLRVARVLRDIQARIGAYFATTIMVACGVGVVVTTGAWLFGWQNPVMWGGIAAMMNLLPYVGPLTMMVLLTLFCHSGEGPIVWSLLPTLAYIVMHTVEANIVTPVLMGRTLSMSPVAILVSLLFFGWVWGVIGIFIAVPLLVVISAFLDHSGRPNVVGFLFGEPLFGQDGTPDVTASEPVEPENAYAG